MFYLKNSNQYTEDNINRKSNQRKLNNGYWKVLENSFYWTKTIYSITYEIFGSKRFKHAFINKNLTLNKHFNASVFFTLTPNPKKTPLNQNKFNR